MKIASREEWLDARKALLAREKELTRQRDEVHRQRRELPWVKVDKQYQFENSQGNETLSDLFNGKSQLLVYHFMFGPDWAEGCPSCSMVADTIDGAIPHLAARDTTLVAVSRATVAQIEAFKKRMGWRFKWLSSYASDFNYDYHVSFTKDQIAEGSVYYNFGASQFPQDEAPGISAFHKDDGGSIYHTYSSYARGLDLLIGPYNYLDLSPKGRDEDGLPMTMSWVRHHDTYEETSSPCCSAVAHQ